MSKANVFRAILTIGLVLHGTTVFAQSNPPPTEHSKDLIVSTVNVEFWFSGTILVFGLVVLSMQYFLIKSSPSAHAEDALRLFTVTIIIVGTLALIAVGYSSVQIAPALGLFGTIIGYLLGRTDERARLRTKESNFEPSPAVSKSSDEYDDKRLHEKEKDTAH